MAAALVVKGMHNEWFNDIDLHVDNSATPFADLHRLLNYHYGRIRVNQALNAIRDGDTTRGLVASARQPCACGIKAYPSSGAIHDLCTPARK